MLAEIWLIGTAYTAGVITAKRPADQYNIVESFFQGVVLAILCICFWPLLLIYEILKDVKR